MKRLNTGIETCVKAGDNGSRVLLNRTILTDEEAHIDWLEGQLHAIAEMGTAEITWPSNCTKPRSRQGM